MLCFSYGSNMSLARLQARVPSARFVAVATYQVKNRSLIYTKPRTHNPQSPHLKIFVAKCQIS